MNRGADDRPAPLAAVLAVTFAGSLSGGVFWAAIFFLTANHYGFSPERNLVLAAAMGAVYAIGAATAGRLVRKRRGVVAARAADGRARLLDHRRARAAARPARRGGHLGRRAAGRRGVGRHVADRRELPGRGPPRRGDAGGDRLVQRHVDAGHRAGAAADAGRRPLQPARHAGAVGRGERGGAGRGVRAARPPRRARGRGRGRRRRSRVSPAAAVGVVAAADELRAVRGHGAAAAPPAGRGRGRHQRGRRARVVDDRALLHADRHVAHRLLARPLGDAGAGGVRAGRRPGDDPAGAHRRRCWRRAWWCSASAWG